MGCPSKKLGGLSKKVSGHSTIPYMATGVFTKVEKLCTLILLTFGRFTLFPLANSNKHL